MPKKSYPLSFPILGGRDLTRALQSNPFQISGGGVVWAWRTEDEGQTKEILVSNFGNLFFQILKTRAKPGAAVQTPLSLISYFHSSLSRWSSSSAAFTRRITANSLKYCIHIALHRGSSKYLTAQDTHITLPLTKHDKTLIRLVKILSFQPRSIIQINKALSVSSIQ